MCPTPASAAASVIVLVWWVHGDRVAGHDEQPVDAFQGGGKVRASSRSRRTADRP